MSSTAVLRARIRLPLDRFALDVDLRTHARVTGLFGPSGCGKTSLVESIAGLRPAAYGDIHFGDTAWQDSERRTYLPPQARGIGYVPQSGLLFPHLTVRGNLECGFRRAEREGSDARRVYTDVVELLELGALAERLPETLSGGERQRVALARALCSAPRLLLLDEPLASLDRPLSRKILPFLRRIRDEFDVPMLFVSHDPTEVQALCDDLVVLREGRILAQGAARDLLTDPAVFSLADVRGFENVVPATIVEAHEGGTVVRLGSPPTELRLVLTATSASARGPCLVGIPARDVLIAVEPPRGLSARNVLPARVDSIESIENFALVKARIDPALPAIVVEIGHAAVRELDLAPGRPLLLIIKAMSCSLFAASR
jgi:molybdate transport system ATP-binding protein